jgi:hypothetical protein
MFLKKQIPLAIAFIFGILLFVQYFVPSRFSEDAYTLYLDWVIVIGIFGSVLAYYSILRLHIMKVAKMAKDWPFSLITLSAIAAMIIAASIEGQHANSTFDNMYNYMLVSIEATIFSMLAFYIASAAYRSFRARSMQATALLVAAVIVMLGRIPFGQYIGIGGVNLVDLANWILDVPNMAAKRGIFLGIGMGMLLLALKLVLGIERSYLGSGD